MPAQINLLQGLATFGGEPRQPLTSGFYSVCLEHRRLPSCLRELTRLTDSVPQTNAPGAFCVPSASNRRKSNVVCNRVVQTGTQRVRPDFAVSPRVRNQPVRASTSAHVMASISPRRRAAGRSRFLACHDDAGKLHCVRLRRNASGVISYSTRNRRGHSRDSKAARSDIQ